MASIERLGNVFYRTQDMEASVRFYTDVLGLTLKLRDGDRWAAFDVGGSTLALEGGAPAGATASLRVNDIAAVVEQLRGRGAQVSDISTGPHERKAEVKDPAGNTLVLYEPLPR